MLAYVVVPAGRAGLEVGQPFTQCLTNDNVIAAYPHLHYGFMQKDVPDWWNHVYRVEILGDCMKTTINYVVAEHMQVLGHVDPSEVQATVAGTKTVFLYDRIVTMLDGALHSLDGRPAVTLTDGSKQQWWVRGKKHREDGMPAVTSLGKQQWWKNGLKHRDDGPAVVAGRLKQWWRNGKLHRDGDLPAIEDGDEKSWWREGKLHRVGKPAYIDDDRREYWEDGMRHREEGPAVTNVRTGSFEFWVRGVRHREGDMPAVFEATKWQHEWWLHGVRHRDGDKPAVVGAPQISEWWVHGKRHRDGGMPALITTKEFEMTQQWYHEGLLHRDHGLPHTVTKMLRLEKNVTAVWGENSRPSHWPLMVNQCK